MLESPAPSFAGCLSDYSVRSPTNGTAQIKPGDKLTGRYYQASGPGVMQAAAAAAAATVSNNAAEAKNAQVAERAGQLAQLERRVAANPGNEELWLLFALQHIDFGAVESMQGELCPSHNFQGEQHTAKYSTLPTCCDAFETC